MDFLTFFFPTRFVRALHSSVKIYLEIENLIGLGGFFNSKLDLWVLLKKGQRKGIFIYYYYYYLWINILFISHTDPRRPHPPWSLSHAINNFYFFCASWTFFIAIFLRIKIYLSARKNHLQSLCNLPHLPLRGWDIWGTFRELDGNMGGKTNPLPPPPPPPFKKKRKDLSHWLHEISLSKNVHHQFFAWATVMPILKNWGYLFC